MYNASLCFTNCMIHENKELGITDTRKCLCDCLKKLTTNLIYFSLNKPKQAERRGGMEPNKNDGKKCGSLPTQVFPFRVGLSTCMPHRENTAN
jgi:hypothetical protein